MRYSIEKHDRQLDTVVALLASLEEHLSHLARIAEMHERRMEGLEG